MYFEGAGGRHFVFGHTENILKHAEAAAAQGEFGTLLLTMNSHYPQLEILDRSGSLCQIIRLIYYFSEFAFLPHVREPIQGDITNGDTSMSPAYFRNKLLTLKLRKLEHTLDDPYQIILFLSK